MVAGSRRSPTCRAYSHTAPLATRRSVERKRWRFEFLLIGSITARQSRRSPASSPLQSERLAVHESISRPRGATKDRLVREASNSGFSPRPAPNRLARLRLRVSRPRGNRPADARPHRQAHGARTERSLITKPLRSSAKCNTDGSSLRLVPSTVDRSVASFQERLTFFPRRSDRGGLAAVAVCKGLGVLPRFLTLALICDEVSGSRKSSASGRSGSRRDFSTRSRRDVMPS